MKRPPLAGLVIGLAVLAAERTDTDTWVLDGGAASPWSSERTQPGGEMVALTEGGTTRVVR